MDSGPDGLWSFQELIDSRTMNQGRRERQAPPKPRWGLESGGQDTVLPGRPSGVRKKGISPNAMPLGWSEGVPIGCHMFDLVTLIPRCKNRGPCVL